MTEPREPTFGEKAVGLNLNPSDDQEVDFIKYKAAKMIDHYDTLRSKATSLEVKRMYSIAITELQTSQMWAVKASTWRD